MQPSFKFRQPGIPLLAGLWRVKKLRSLVRTKRALFVPAGDTVSLEPLAFDTYEHGVSKLLEHFSQLGYCHALFDIGTNIGLSTVYSEAYFTKIFCFEPNPILFDVLRANTRQLTEKTTLFNFGLGPEDKICTLRVPRHNVGGGYVDDEDNTLSAADLARKDGIDDTGDDRNHLSVEVEIRCGRTVIGDILLKLKPNETLLFKIDVEGYEKTVLTEIASALSSKHKAIIIFENFSEEITPEFIHSIFNKVQYIGRLKSSLEDRPYKFLKFLHVLLFGREYSIDFEPKKLLGEIIVSVG